MQCLFGPKTEKLWGPKKKKILKNSWRCPGRHSNDKTNILPNYFFCQNPDTLGTNLQPTPLVRTNIRDDLVYKTRNLEDSMYNKMKENESIAHSQKLDNTGIYTLHWVAQIFLQKILNHR